jgi:hypothetical protein
MGLRCLILVEPGGTTGSYILFDKSTLQPLALVNQADSRSTSPTATLARAARRCRP